MQTYDVIVIGAGGVGSAAMATLARRGLSVLAIDRFAPPHDSGSSHGESRVIRQAYFEHPDYVPLLRRTYLLWRELEQRTGTALFNQCGLLEVGPADGEVVPGVLRAASEHTLAVELLTARQVVERWPALRVPDGLTAVFEPTAGYLHVERCVAAMLNDAQRHGGKLLPNCKVQNWRANDRQVEVVTASGTFAAASLLVTAGAWAGQLLTELALQLTPLQKSMFWYSAAGVKDATRLPVFLYELDSLVPYGFPSIDGVRMKIAQHAGGLPLTDPLVRQPSAVAAEQQSVEQFLRRCLRGVTTPPLGHATCLYTMTPDGHFVVDHHPNHPNVAFAAGLSGHGFKFAPVVGEALADLVTNGATSLPIGFLSARRFHS